MPSSLAQSTCIFEDPDGADHGWTKQHTPIGGRGDGGTGLARLIRQRLGARTIERAGAAGGAIRDRSARSPVGRRRFAGPPRDLDANRATAMRGATALPLLRKALRDPDPKVRSRAARTLHWSGQAKATAPALIAALKDPDRDVRDAAAWALGAVGPEAGEPQRGRNSFDKKQESRHASKPCREQTAKHLVGLSTTS